MSAAEPLPGEPDEGDSVALPSVTNPADAEWRLRRYNRLKAQRAEHEATFRELTEQTETWFAEETSKIDRELAELEFILGGFIKARIAEDPDGPKSINLPSGRIATTAGGLSVQVTDEDAFLAWAKAQRPDLVATPAPPPPPPPRPDKAAIKSWAAEAMPKSVLEEPGTWPIVVSDGDHAVNVPGVALVRAGRSVKVEGGRY